MKPVRSFILPAVAVALTFGVVGFFQRPASVEPSTMAEVRQEAERGGYRIIDADTLWGLYRSNREKILLVDTRQEWEHRAGHIDGSTNFPTPPSWTSRWLKKGALKEFLGPNQDKSIVFY